MWHLRTRLHARFLALVVEERAELGLVLVVQLLEIVVVEGVHLVGVSDADRVCMQ